MGLTVIDVHDLEPAFNRLCSEQPNIPEQNMDVIHRPTGFGKWAMPKLRHNISSKDETVAIAAIESLSELVIDPVGAFEAIRLKIIDRLVNLMVSENPVLRERTALALWKIAKLTTGREAIANNKGLLNNISICCDDNYEEVRLHAAKLLQTVAEFWKTADDLIEFGFIPILLHILQGKEEQYVNLIHLKTLRCLMYSIHGKMIAIDNYGFPTFLQFIRDENSEIVSEALACLAMIASTCVGEKLAREENLLPILNFLLQDERPEIHSQAASVIMFCTVKTTGKIMASEYPSMVTRLLELAQNRLNPGTQMFAIKALSNICEHPKMRKWVKDEYQHLIDAIQVGDNEDIKQFKEVLVKVTGWTPKGGT